MYETKVNLGEQIQTLESKIRNYFESNGGREVYKTWMYLLELLGIKQTKAVEEIIKMVRIDEAFGHITNPGASANGRLIRYYKPVVYKIWKIQNQDDVIEFKCEDCGQYYRSKYTL